MFVMLRIVVVGVFLILLIVCMVLVSIFRYLLEMCICNRYMKIN